MTRWAKYGWPRCIRTVDSLMVPAWGVKPTPLKIRIVAWPAAEAARQFCQWIPRTPFSHGRLNKARRGRTIGLDQFVPGQRPPNPYTTVLVLCVTTWACAEAGQIATAEITAAAAAARMM